MKFLFFIFTFFILILSAGIISAATLSGSPSSLNFNLNIGEEKCMIFVVSSLDYSGDLTSIMKWAEKDSEVSSLDDFTLDNSETELSVIYSPETISNFDGEEGIEVCISGDEIGTWKGSLEYRTESSGNIGVGVGVWLRVSITEQTDETENQGEQIPPATSSGGGGGSSSSTYSNPSSIDSPTGEIDSLDSEEEKEETPLGELEEESEERKGFFSMTGSTVEKLVSTTTGKSIGILIAIAMIFIAIKIYKKSFRK